MNRQEREKQHREHEEAQLEEQAGEQEEEAEDEVESPIEDSEEEAENPGAGILYQVQVIVENTTDDDNTVPVLDDNDERERELLE